MAVAESDWREYRRTKDEKLKDKLIEAHLPLVKYIAGRLAVKLPPHADQQDLESCGIFGLMEAVEKYDPGLGVSFNAYASARIRGAMLDELRKMNWLPRTLYQKIHQLNTAREKLDAAAGGQAGEAELAAALGIGMEELKKLAAQAASTAVASLDDSVVTAGGEVLRWGDLIPDFRSPDPLEEVERGEAREILARAVEELPERDKLVLALYYQEGLTLKEIGRVLEVTESRVCQLHSRALKKLKDKLKEYFV